MEEGGNQKSTKGKVSEELSSVETQMLNEVQNILYVFQKNLVVWKHYPHLYKTNQFTKVSEELSSVETRRG